LQNERMEPKVHGKWSRTKYDRIRKEKPVAGDLHPRRSFLGCFRTFDGKYLGVPPIVWRCAKRMGPMG